MDVPQLTVCFVDFNGIEKATSGEKTANTSPFEGEWEGECM